jgi:hypothetical protein
MANAAISRRLDVLLIALALWLDATVEKEVANDRSSRILEMGWGYHRGILPIA